MPRGGDIVGAFLAELEQALEPLVLERDRARLDQLLARRVELGLDLGILRRREEIEADRFAAIVEEAHDAAPRRGERRGRVERQRPEAR